MEAGEVNENSEAHSGIVTVVRLFFITAKIGGRTDGQKDIAERPRRRRSGGTRGAGGAESLRHGQKSASAFDTQEGNTLTLVDRVWEVVHQIEERTTEIESGIDTLDIIGNEYFKDGTGSAYREAQEFLAEKKFARSSNALLFVGGSMREALDCLRDNVDLLFKLAREMAEKLEDTAEAEEIALDAVTVLQKEGRAE